MNHTAAHPSPQSLLRVLQNLMHRLKYAGLDNNNNYNNNNFNNKNIKVK